MNKIFPHRFPPLISNWSWQMAPLPETATVKSVFPSHCHQVFAHEAYDTPIGHYCCDVALYIKKEYNLTELYSGPYLQI